MIPKLLQVHTATVEPYEGSGAYGDIYGTAYDLPCYFEQSRRLVRNPDGDEVISEATVYADLGDSIPNDSRVTVGGYASRVITVSLFDDAGVTGLAHREIALE